MEILDVIGEGGFAIVKKARDLINNEMTAIKIIDSKSMNIFISPVLLDISERWNIHYVQGTKGYVCQDIH